MLFLEFQQKNNDVFSFLKIILLLLKFSVYKISG